MTPLDRALRDVVADGGALGAAALDRATRAVLASHGPLALAQLPVLDVLLGGPPPGGPLTRACGGPPVDAARALFVAGPERALFVALLGTGEAVVVATRPSMSVALGWSLVRRLIAAVEATLATDPP